MSCRSRALTWTGLLLLVCTPALAQKVDFATRARELASLRSELERLESEIQMEREVQRSDLRSLAAQEEELDLLLQKERIRLAALRKIRVRLQAGLKAAQARIEDLVSPLQRAAERLEKALRRSLPFRLDERLGELEELRQGLDSGTLDPETTTSRLWQLVEDELDLCTGTELQRQVVEVDGNKELAEVVRVGMVALYFRTTDGRYGHAARSGDTWRFETFGDRPRSRAVETIFEAMKRQIRQGLFELPLSISSPEAGP